MIMDSVLWWAAGWPENREPNFSLKKMNTNSKRTGTSIKRNQIQNAIEIENQFKTVLQNFGYMDPRVFESYKRFVCMTWESDRKQFKFWWFLLWIFKVRYLVILVQACFFDRWSCRWGLLMSVIVNLWALKRGLRVRVRVRVNGDLFWMEFCIKSS